MRQHFLAFTLSLPLSLAQAAIFEQMEGDPARIEIECHTPKKTCGNFTFSTGSCPEGQLSYVGEKRGGHEFREKSTANRCPPACTLWISSNNDYYVETCQGKITRRGKLGIPAEAQAANQPVPPLVPEDTPVVTIPAGNAVYTGQFLIGETGGVTGIGRIQWNNGDRYEGEVIDSQRSGRGAFIWANGDNYQGQMQNNEPHGQGIYTWKNGNRYEGQWENGLKHGQGRLTYADGSTWEGEFRQDRQTANGQIAVAGPSQPGKISR